MHATIIFSHPWHGSFNKAILDTVVEAYEQNGKSYQIIDLNKDGFNPVMLEQDLALYAKGQSTDPLVLKYQNTLNTTEELVFIFPIWWYNIPAILKGFIDKVMLKNFAYVETKTGLKGQLKHIRKTSIFTTSETPTILMNLLKGNPIHGVLIRGTLKGLGLRNIKWYNSGLITRSSQSKRQRYLQQVAKIISHE